ncbi:hypothetical protein [Thermovirga lienii]|uniref:hypothetical protein n=1 Tax=Thermovirga lienii TaxID=336261 RepID=UPI002FE24A5F
MKATVKKVGEILLQVALGSAFGALMQNIGFAASDNYYTGDTQSFIDMSVKAIKIARFVALFLCIVAFIVAGVTWAFADDSREGKGKLIKVAAGTGIVLLAVVIVQFLIGGFGFGDISAGLGR